MQGNEREDAVARYFAAVVGRMGDQLHERAQAVSTRLITSNVAVARAAAKVQAERADGLGPPTDPRPASSPLAEIRQARVYPAQPGRVEAVSLQVFDALAQELGSLPGPLTVEDVQTTPTATGRRPPGDPVWTQVTGPVVGAPTAADLTPADLTALSARSLAQSAQAILANGTALDTGGQRRFAQALAAALAGNEAELAAAMTGAVDEAPRVGAAARLLVLQMAAEPGSVPFHYMAVQAARMGTASLADVLLGHPGTQLSRRDAALVADLLAERRQQPLPTALTGRQRADARRRLGEHVDATERWEVTSAVRYLRGLRQQGAGGALVNMIFSDNPRAWLYGLENHLESELIDQWGYQTNDFGRRL